MNDISPALERTRDTARLSWLDRDDIELDCGTVDGIPVVRIYLRKNGKLMGEGFNIRAAIDAAMKDRA